MVVVFAAVVVVVVIVDPGSAKGCENCTSVEIKFKLLIFAKIAAIENVISWRTMFGRHGIHRGMALDTY